MSSRTELTCGPDGTEPPWAEALWRGACPADEMPAWAVEIAVLIEAARGPATDDERSAESVVVARMQAATDRGAGRPVPHGARHPDAAGATDGDHLRGEVTQLGVRRRRAAEAVYRAAVAKVAVVVGVLALVAVTATGGPTAFASFVEDWIDSFLPGAGRAPSVEAPSQGHEDADHGTGGQPSTRRSQRPAGDGSSGASGNDRAQDQQGSSPGQDPNVSANHNPEAVPPGHGGVVPGQGTPPLWADEPTSAGSEDPAGGSADHSGGSSPGRTGTPPSHAGPSDGGSGGHGEQGEPPGRAGTSPGQGGGVPKQSAAARGFDGTSPGQGGGVPEQSAAARGFDGGPPGQGGGVPEQSAAARGFDGGPPGQDGGSPGQSGGAAGRNGAASRPGGTAGPNIGWSEADVSLLEVVLRSVTSLPARG